MSPENKNSTDTNNYKNIVENLPVPVVIYTLEGKILYANPKAIEKEGIKGVDYRILNISDFVPPHVLNDLKERRKNILSGAKLPPFELEKKNINGETVYIEINSSPIIYDGIEAIQIIITDTTASRLLQEERIRTKIIEQTNKHLQKQIELRTQSEFKTLSTQAQLTAIINNTTDIVVSIDKNYNIVQFNQLLFNMVNRRNSLELKEGMPVFDTMDSSHHSDMKNIYERVFSEGRGLVAVELFTVAGGKKRYFESNYNPIKQGNETIGIAIFSRDISEKIESETELRSALKEKEVLLKEVHHRVKNNLQVISSILNLQTSYVKDKETANILKECQNRIKTMAYIHESLYQTKDFLQINFSEYITNLVKNLFYSYDANQQKIKAIFDIDAIFLNLDTSIPCGLIINELVSNALKYAFIDCFGGVVAIKVKKTNNNRIKMTVSDNGGGIPDNIDYRNTETLGLQLVTILAEQINGTIVLKRTKGTTFEIIF